jgi:flagellar biosynthesis/type III secretory pathway chaperone
MPDHQGQVFSDSSRLQDVLSALLERLDRLSHLTAREQTAIRALAVQDLTEVMQQKTAVLADICSLNQQRTDLVTGIARQWAVNDASLTLIAIASRVGGEQGRMLREQHAKLVRMIDAVQEDSRFTAAVLRRSLAFLQAGMQTWSSTEQTPVYSIDGTVAHAGRPLVERRG